MKKIGDKVKVKSDLIVGKLYGGLTFFEDMSSLRGKVLTIDNINCSGNINAIETPYFISSEMLESTEEMFNVDDITKALKKVHAIKAVLDKAGLGYGADLEAYYKIKEIMEGK